MVFQSGILARTPFGRYAAFSMDMPFYSAAFLMISALVLGGGGAHNGYLSDAILQALSIPVFIFSLWRLSTENLSSQIKWALVFCLVVVAVPLLQLVPLPPDIWRQLPGRDVIISALDAAGLEAGWMPFSVSPQATWLSLAAMLPSLSIFLMTLLLGHQDRQRLVLVIIATGLVSVFIGLLQVARGPDSLLRFFGSGNDAEGFFANRNHFAALVYTLIVLVSARIWIQTGRFSSRSGKSRKGSKNSRGTGPVLQMLAGFAVIMVLVGAALMARSRAGIALTIIALLAGYFLTVGMTRKSRHTANRKTQRLVMGGVLLAFIFSTQFALYRTLDRFGQGVDLGERASFRENTIRAAWSFMPAGSGLGTFIPVYKVFEKPETTLMDRYTNRAHNDLLELWLETGVFGMMLAAIAALFLMIRVIRLWSPFSHDTEDDNIIMARAATLVIVLLGAHSLIDYPLRTHAMAAILVFSAALLFRPVVDK